MADGHGPFPSTINHQLSTIPMPDFDVITFGETMIRLSPPGHERLETAASLDLRVGGSESNTAVALAQLGRRTAWWSKLPDSPLGRRVAQEIARWGVDISLVVWAADARVGVYFIELGATPRPHQVHYDRADSAVSTLDPSEIDWGHLSRARHLHVTGITVALSECCEGTVARSVLEAKNRGVTVSLDVNYRRKLIGPEALRGALDRIFPHVDLLICPTSDAAAVFGVRGTAEQVAKALAGRSGIPNVVVTHGREGAVALTPTGFIGTRTVCATEIDRIGAGDAFDAGVIDGFLDGDLARGLRYGAAMAALKHTIPGDQFVGTRADVEACAAGIDSGIQR